MNGVFSASRQEALSAGVCDLNKVNDGMIALGYAEALQEENLRMNQTYNRKRLEGEQNLEAFRVFREQVNNQK